MSDMFKALLHHLGRAVDSSGKRLFTAGNDCREETQAEVDALDARLASIERRLDAGDEAYGLQVRMNDVVKQRLDLLQQMLPDLKPFADRLTAIEARLDRVSTTVANVVAPYVQRIEKLEATLSRLDVLDAPDSPDVG